MNTEWIYDMLKEYVIKEGIRTTSDRLDTTYEYMLSEGYGESLGVAAGALSADSKIREMLEK